MRHIWMLLAVSLAACDQIAPERYAAEVGFYHGDEIGWDLWGNYSTLDECRNAAIARFNVYAADN